MKHLSRLLALILVSAACFAQNPMLRNFSCVDSGVSDAYACNLLVAPSGYVSGQIYQFTANTANTGAASLNLNSLGAKTIVKVAGGITTTLANNDIQAGQIVLVVYDGTNMQMVSQLGNASAGITNGVLTMEVSGVTPSGTQFMGVSGLAATGVGTTGTVTAIDQVMANAGTGIALYAKASAAEGVAATLAFTIEKNGSDTTITCTVPNSGTTCNDTGHSFSWVAGDTLAIKTIQTGTGTSAGLKVSLAYN